jgi:hypothetical protein
MKRKITQAENRADEWYDLRDESLKDPQALHFAQALCTGIL